VHFVPWPDQVTLEYRKDGGISYIDTSIELTTSGYNVSTWGIPVSTGNNISVDAEIWRWTGVVIPVVITLSHTYNIGSLRSGQYTFTFKVWLFPVKSTTFTLPITVPDDYFTIQEAINNANAGDTIHVKAGTYYENVVVNKTVSLIGESQENTVIEGFNRTGFLINITVSDVTVEGFTLRNGHHAIHASPLQNDYLDNIIIRNNTIAQNNLGVLISCPRYCRVENNVITSNREAVDLLGNPVKLGLENTVKGNVITHQENHSITIMWSLGTEVVENTISFNTGTQYSYSGLRLWHSNHTVAYHNNFIENFNQVYLEESYDNVWDNGCEGNYWSDYNGTDLDYDGVGDTFLPWQGVDYCPLMNPYWNLADINHDLKVDGKDITIVAMAFSAYYPGHQRWNPHGDINQDGKIDGKDITLVAKNFGKQLKQF